MKGNSPLSSLSPDHHFSSPTHAQTDASTMHPVMRVFIFIIAFVLTLGLLFAAAAPVSVPGASGLQDARGPATQDVAPTSETVRAPLFETVLNLLPTLQVSRAAWRPLATPHLRLPHRTAP